jgi:hypothetical protein
MKTLTIAALIGAQLLAAAQPALAAELDEPRIRQMGAFGGLRFRVPLDGNARQRQVRAGLTIAPTLHSRSAEGETRLRIGEGLELGVAGREPMRLSLAGMPVSRLAEGPVGPDGQRLGVSTLGWIAIGVGAVVVLTVGAIALCMEDSECNPSE